jgi:hypothetical protein
MSTVYVVAGGVNYEGEALDTVRVFLSRDAAVAYGESLTAEQEDLDETRYDYYEIVETVVS